MRQEHDLLGTREVPDSAYWGIHTLRATENFPLPVETVGQSRELVRALGQVKLAAALANRDLGVLDESTVAPIAAACQRVIDGELDDQFPVSLIQGGAGTSTNMNANEVIANAALEHLGHSFGQYSVLHPNEHVNQGQSTNDVYPTALKLSTIYTTHLLIDSLERLAAAFKVKADEFADVVKVGRTQLQDAVPMTMGQEFGAYQVMILEDIARLREALAHLHEINLGATAIGTGINAHPDFAPAVREHLRKISGLPLLTAPNLIESTQDCGAFVLMSGTLKRTAIKLSKVCNDLRLLSSGPRTGFGEISLPAMQAGSSIMPGKVNPVIPEMVNQVAFSIIGNDMTISMAAEAGQLQLNAFEPIIAYSLLRGLTHLAIAADSLAVDCVSGIMAHPQRLRELAEANIGMVTVFSPVLGYTTSTAIAAEALATDSRVTDLIVEQGLLTREEVDHFVERALSPIPG
ncbi:aspartate ammonia-lyase [Glutamicibacter sp. JC586]|uniref:aspartate ammonia-lyase n=1 Tax=Glutamicibacter sp. JC586 TaxID=2590552 RepID=UPI001F3C6B4A|nr:aspartate ammonia-lyase [Glutamicibacter sp. JC586]